MARRSLYGGWLCALTMLALCGCSQLPKVQSLNAAGAVLVSVTDQPSGVSQTINATPMNAGNSVQLLQDGQATYQAMLKAIEAAQDHIHVETYIFDNDEVGRSFAAILMDKQQQGVQVHLIRDSVGTFSTQPEFFETLKSTGIKVLEFNPINPLMAKKDWSLNQRDHRKLLIVDGQKAFLGGINISSIHSGGSFGKRSRRPNPDAKAWRDTHVQLQGPVVADLQKLFLASWDKQKGEPLPPKNYFPDIKLAGSTQVRAIGSTPDEPYSQMYAALLTAMNEARTSIYLTNAYFVPDPQLLATLEAARRRGVDVRLILPGKTDSWFVFHAGRSHYSRLLQAGVKIYELRPTILHSKTALIDGVWASVGSTNLDWRSFLHNDELDAIILGADFGSQLKAVFDKDLANSDEVTLAQWQRRSLDLRLKEGFARIWEYWL